MALQDKRYGTNLDLQGYQLKNHRLEVLASDPGGSNAGDIWFNSTDAEAKVYDGANARALYADDDDFFSLPLITSADDADHLLVAEASDSNNYKRITRANFLTGAGTVFNAYYRIIAESGTANLDASGEDDIAISGDGSILETVGSTAGNQTLTVDWLTQTANLFLAGPTTGGAAQPTFRAIVDNDMPTSYNTTNWDSAYNHSVLVAGNPHAVTAAEVSAEGLLGNPVSDGYLLSSTAAGVRSWVTPDVLGGQALDASITAPSVGEDGFSVVWDDGNNRFALSNVTASSGITVSGTPAAAQLGIWATASSMLGNAFMVTDFATDTVLDLSASGSDNPVYRLSDGANNFDIYLDNATNTSRISAYGDLYIHPYTSGNVYIGATAIANTLFAVHNDTGTPRTYIAQFVDSATDEQFTIAESGQVYAQGIGGSGTATSTLFYNRTTGEITYGNVITGSGYWSRTVTDVSLATANDTLLMRVTESIAFGDGDTYITESADDSLDLYSGAAQTLRFNPTETIFYVHISAAGTGIDIGGTGQFFRNAYTNQYYVEDVNTRLYLDGSGNLTLEDINAGAVTLNSIASHIASTSNPHSVDEMVYPTASGIPIVVTGTSWGTTISNDSANWNTAYGWGDHSGLYELTGAVSTHESTYNHANYNTAYSWGDHAGLYANISHTLLSHTISGETLGHVLAADSATTYSIRELLGSEINNDLTWITGNQTITLTGVIGGSGTTSISTNLAVNGVHYSHLNDDVIAGQPDLASGLVATDELFVSDGGVLKKMDVSVLEAYMQANLSFGGASLWTTGNDATHGDYVIPITAAINVAMEEGGRLLMLESGYETAYIFQDNGAMYFGTEGVFNFNKPIFLSDASGYFYGASGATIGTNLSYWSAMYADTYYVEDNSTYLDLNAGDLRFTDTNSGTVTLASLIAGASLWTADTNGITYTAGNVGIGIASAAAYDLYVQGHTRVNNWISAHNGGDNVGMWGNLISFSASGINYIQAHNVVGYIAIVTNSRPESEANSNIVFHADQTNSMPGLGDNDTEDHIVAINDSTGLLTKRSVASIIAGSGYWTRTAGQYLSPTNAGDDILLATATERLAFNDADTYIFESVDDTISVVCDNNTIITFNTSAIVVTEAVRGTTTSGYDLGTSSYWWRNLYVDTIYIDDTSTHISNVAGDMTFEDTNAGPVSLATLVAGGSGDVSWGTTTNDYVVLGSTGGDIASTVNLSYSVAGSQLLMNGATGSSIRLQYNSVNGLIVSAVTAGGSRFVSDGTLWFESQHATLPHIGFGSQVDGASFITIGDSSNTAQSVVRINNASNLRIAQFEEDRTITFPGLGDNDTEDHVVSINDSTGLLTKRSVASIVAEAVTSDVSVTNQANNRVVTATAVSDTLNAEANLTFDGTDALISGAGSLTFRSAANYIYSASANTLTIGAGSADGIIIDTNSVNIGLALEMTAGNIIYLDGSAGDSRIWDATGDLTFRDVSNAAGVTLSDLVAGLIGYPDAGIALSTGSAWGASIPNNSANWNTAYTHSTAVTGNPHSVTTDDLVTFTFPSYIPFANATPDDFLFHTGFQYNSGTSTLSAQNLDIQSGGEIGDFSSTIAGDYTRIFGAAFIMYSGGGQVTNFNPDSVLTAYSFDTEDPITGTNTQMAWRNNGNFHMSLYGQGSLRLWLYGSGTFTGTEAYGLYVDSSGNIIEGAVGTGAGTVTAVNNGNGMNFTNITVSGAVTLGTPGTLTSATSNGVTTSSHTHAISTGIANTNIVRIESLSISDNEYARFTAAGLESRSYAELAADIDGSVFNFSASNNVTAGNFQFYDNVELEMGSSNDISIYFSSSHLHFDAVSGTTDIIFRTVTTPVFTFDMGTYKGTATDWIATSDIRVKDNIRPFELDMDKFLILGSRAIRHNWKEGYGAANTEEIGFIAQDVEAFFPELVTIGSARPYFRGISYGKLSTVAIKATAQTWEYAVAIDSKVDAVQSEVEGLKIKVKKLQDELNTLQNG